MPFPLQKNMHIGHEWRATALMLDEQFPMLLPCRSKSEVGQSRTCSVIVSGEHAARDDRQSYAYHFAMLLLSLASVAVDHQFQKSPQIVFSIISSCYKMLRDIRDQQPVHGMSLCLCPTDELGRSRHGWFLVKKA